MKKLFTIPAAIFLGCITQNVAIAQSSYCIDDFSVPANTFNFITAQNQQIIDITPTNSIFVGQVLVSANSITQPQTGDFINVMNNSRMVSRDLDIAVFGNWRALTLIQKGNPTRTSEAVIENNKLIVDNGYLAKSRLQLIYGNANLNQPFGPSTDLSGFNSLVLNDFFGGPVSVIVRIISFDDNNNRTLDMVRFEITENGDLVLPFSLFPRVDFSKVYRIALDFETNKTGSDWEIGGICAVNSSSQSLKQTTNFEVIEDKQLEVTLFPNPASSFVNVSLSEVSTSNNVSYSLFDLNGKVVSNKNLGNISSQNAFQIDTQNMANGVYFLTITAGDNMLTKKLVITNK